MKESTVVVPVLLFVGVLAGYIGYPYLHAQTAAAASTASGLNPDGLRQTVTLCNLSNDQIDHLAGRLAPVITERLGGFGSKEFIPDPTIAARKPEAPTNVKTEQTAAYTQAAQLIDQMITNRQVTQEGLGHALALLQQTGQGDRAYELQGRIAAAVNKKEITPSQAGLMLPGQFR